MNKGVLRISVFLAVGALGLYGVRHFHASPRGERAEDKIAEEKTDLAQKVFIFSIDGKTSKGARQWHLEGKAAELVGNDIHLDDLTAVAYGEGYTVNLTSDRGVYRKSKAEVELEGDVRVVSDDGVTLSTERAMWSQETREITTDSVVNIERENMRATGAGGMANSYERKAWLRSNVIVQLEPATIVKCDGSLEVDFDGNKAVFSGNVRVADKDGRLRADLLTVYFDPETRKIAEVVAEGNVKLIKGESYTVCEKATYTDGTKSIKFLGRPKVVIASEELGESGFLGGTGMPGMARPSEGG